MKKLITILLLLITVVGFGQSDLDGRIPLRQIYPIDTVNINKPQWQAYIESLAPSGSTDYISNLSLSGNTITATGIGLAFNSTIGNIANTSYSNVFSANQYITKASPTLFLSSSGSVTDGTISFLDYNGTANGYLKAKTTGALEISSNASSYIDLKTTLKVPWLSSGYNVVGGVYYDIEDDKFYGRTSSSWVDLGAGASGSGTVTSVTAGNGMTQTGTSTINPTLNIVSHGGTVGVTGTLNVSADAVGVTLGTSATSAYRGDYGNAAYVGRISSLTTNGTSGAATFINNVLNIPQYTGGGGMTDPMTTRGDLIYRNSSNTTARLPIGSNGYVLTSNGTDAIWASPTGGSSYWQQLTGAVAPLTISDEVRIGSTTDLGIYKLQVDGNAIVTNNMSVQGDIVVDGSFTDSNGSTGGTGQYLGSTGTGTDWIDMPISLYTVRLQEQSTFSSPPNNYGDIGVSSTASGRGALVFIEENETTPTPISANHKVLGGAAISANSTVDAERGTNYVASFMSGNYTFTLNSLLPGMKGTITIGHIDTTARTITIYGNEDGAGNDYTAKTPNGSGGVSLTTSGTGYIDVLRWDYLMNGTLVVTHDIVH